MPTTFPAALDNLTNPAADDPRTGHAAQHADVNDAVEAIESAIGTMSSPALARLAGIAGGQTLIGGTGATDKLTLQATSASGTTGTDKAALILVGSAGAIEAITILQNGSVGIGQTEPVYLLDVGSGVRKMQIDSDARVGIGCLPNTALGGSSYVPSFAVYCEETTTSQYRCAAQYVLIADPPALAPLYHTALSLKCDSKTGNSFNITGGLGGLDAQVNHYGTGIITNAVPSKAWVWNRSTGTITAATACYATSTNNSTGQITDNTVLYAQGNNASTGTITTNRALQAYCRNNSTGTITSNIGNDIYLRNIGAGSITSNIGTMIKAVNGAGTITNNIGFEIGGGNSTWSNSGTVSNNTVFLIGNSTNFGTNKKAIDCQSTADSAFAGKLGIGNSAPTAKLDVMATTEQLRLGYDATYFADFKVNSAGALKIAAPLSWMPAASATPSANGEITIEFTSNTQVTIKGKGTDGVVRSVALTLS